MQIAKFGVNKSEANKECMKLSLQVLQFSESTQYVLSIDNREYLLWRKFFGEKYLLNCCLWKRIFAGVLLKRVKQ